MNYNDNISGLTIWSHLKINRKLFQPIKYTTSDLLKNYADTICSKLNLDSIAGSTIIVGYVSIRESPPFNVLE